VVPSKNACARRDNLNRQATAEMNARIALSVLTGAIVSFGLVAGRSEIVRTCGRPSWLDTLRGETSNVHPAAPGSGLEAPYGIVCDYFPSALEIGTNALLVALSLLVGGAIAGAISRRGAWVCGGGAALLGAIAIATPGIILTFENWYQAYFPAWVIVAETIASLVVAALVGSLGGAIVARVWPRR
jgi:hypothetical protein